MSTQPPITPIPTPGPQGGTMIQKIKNSKVLTVITVVVTFFVVLALVAGGIALFRGDSSADGGDDTTTSTTEGPKTEEELKKRLDAVCGDLEHVDGFVREYPGTAIGSNGQLIWKSLPFVADDLPATFDRSTDAILDQIESSRELLFYWAHMAPNPWDATQSQAAVDMATEIQKWIDDPAEMKKDCEAVVRQLRGGRNVEAAKLLEVNPEDGQFSLMYFVDDYTEVQVICYQSAPPAGLHVWSWNDGSSESRAGSIRRVQVALEYNALFYTECEAGAMAIPFPSQETTEATPESTTTPPATDDSDPQGEETTDSTTATGTETGTNTDDGTSDTGNGGSNGGGATDGGGNGHDNGGCGNADCGDGGGGNDCASSCDGPGPGDEPGPGGDCPSGTCGEGTNPPQTSPPVTQPPATQPPATQPPATTTTTTQPPATQPPQTTTTTTQPPATQPPATTTTTTQPPQTTVPCPPGYTRLPDGRCKSNNPGLPDV